MLIRAPCLTTLTLILRESLSTTTNAGQVHEAILVLRRKVELGRVVCRLHAGFEVLKFVCEALAAAGIDGPASLS